MSLTEQIQIFGLLTFLLFAVMFGTSFVLKYFVALKATPLRRTLWMVGGCYLLGVSAFLFGGPLEFQLWSPLAGLPGAALLGWLLHREFKARWVDDSEGVPEGVTLSNDDWKVGLLFIVGLFAVAAVKVLLREM